MANQEELICFSQIKQESEVILKQIIERTLDRKAYNAKDAQSWTNQISDESVKRMTEFNKNFKYMVNCLIMQKAECGLNMSGSCYWDSEIDGNLSVNWENQSIICVLSIFAVGL